MCGRVIQSSGPLRYGIVDGMDMRDSRVHNYPPRWNGAPSQELLIIRHNHETGQVSLDPLRWGLIPYWCKDPKGGVLAGFRAKWLVLKAEVAGFAGRVALLTALGPF